MQKCWSITILETKHATIQFNIITTLFIIQLLLLLQQNVIAQTGDPSSSSPSSKDQVVLQYPLQLSPGMAVLFVGLIATFFIVGCLSIYVRRCMEAWLGNSSGRGVPIRDQSQGIDPKVIHKFPTFLYSDVKYLTIGKTALECAVCLSEFDDDATLRLLPGCCHVFHIECIDTWLTAHVTCPVCRANLEHVTEEEMINHPNNLPMWEFVPGSAHSTRSQESSELPSGMSTVTIVVQSPSRDHDPAKSRLQISKIFNSRGRDIERFTLRLPEGGQQRLENTGLRRVVSDGMFPTERSPKRWFRRSTSVGTGRGITNNYVYNERFDWESRSDRWG